MQLTKTIQESVGKKRKAQLSVNIGRKKERRKCSEKGKRQKYGTQNLKQKKIYN